MNKKLATGLAVMGVIVGTNIFSFYSGKDSQKEVSLEKQNNLTAIFNKNKAELKVENKNLIIENKDIASFKDQLKICNEQSKEKDYQMSALRDSIRFN